MLGFSAVLRSAIPSITRPIPTLSSNSRILPFFLTNAPTRRRSSRNLRRCVNFAKIEDGLKEQRENNNGDNDEDELKRDLQKFLDVKWKDLLYPDQDNLVAVGLTGLLTWASVQVLWQLLVISFAILVAALKYSFIAALLLFILITLL